MSTKAKGTHAERELFHMLWDQGFAVLRCAGSGSTTKPAVDLIAGNRTHFLAIECKALKGKAKYLSQDDIEQLLTFAQQFGAEAWLAVRFDNKGWRFIEAQKIEKSKGNSFVVSYEWLQKQGVGFEDLIQ